MSISHVLGWFLTFLILSRLLSASSKKPARISGFNLDSTSITAFINFGSFLFGYEGVS